MHTSYPGSSTPSHSNEVEKRLTTSEITIQSHGVRLTALERMLMGIIYAIGVLSAGKAGDVADLLLNILKAKT